MGLIPGWIKDRKGEGEGGREGEGGEEEGEERGERREAYLHSCEHEMLDITKNLIDGRGLRDSPSVPLMIL